MSGINQCHREQPGIQCTCDACLDLLLADSGADNCPESQQSYSGPKGRDGFELYNGFVKPSMFDENFTEDPGVAAGPMNNQLGQTNQMGGQGQDGFAAINMGHQEGDFNSSGGGLFEPQEVNSADVETQPQQAADQASPTVDSPAVGEQAKPRSKRKSKYTEDPPTSIYGPPFLTKEVTARMTEEEIRSHIEYNAAVNDARKVFLRHKNNLAAKKSRERKQALINDLTQENKGYTMHIARLEATNRDLLEKINQLHGVDNMNQRLRREYDAMCKHAAELARRLEALGEQNPPVVQPNGDVPAEMNNDIENFLTNLNKGEFERYNWENFE